MSEPIYVVVKISGYFLFCLTKAKVEGFPKKEKGPKPG
jgi:hypothetical protein